MPNHAIFLSPSGFFRCTLLLACVGVSLKAETHSTPYTLVPLAGVSSIGSADGQGSAARFNKPLGVATDTAGNVYVADTGNQTIRKISPGGLVTTLAGEPGLRGGAEAPNGRGAAAQFSEPTNLVVDTAGNIFITDFNGYAIRKITSGGDVSTYINRSSFDPSSMPIQKPWGITRDSAGNIYYTDSDTHTVHKIDPTRKITLVAGQTYQSGTVDGPSTQALFAGPATIAVDPAGNLYVSQFSQGAIRKISPNGTVSTIANSIVVNGPYFSPVEADLAGNLYVAGTFSGIIGKIPVTGSPSVIAGGQQSPGPGDYQDGPALSAKFEYPADLGVDLTGNLFVADTGNNVIRKITPDGQVSTLAGLAMPKAIGNVDGSGDAARFSEQLKVCAVPGGNLVVADYANCTLRKITSAGVVTTIAGASGVPAYLDGAGSAARFKGPYHLAPDAAGNVYVFDQGKVRKVTPDGNVTTVVETVRLSLTDGMAVDATGNIFVSGDNCIKRITPAGDQSVFAGKEALSDTPPSYSSGNTDGVGPDARFDHPTGLAFDRSGNLYVADTGNHTIRKITPDRVVTTPVGSAGMVGHDDGKGSAALFFGPKGLSCDDVGNLWVADTNNGLIRRVTPDGTVTTVAGYPFANGNSGGTGTEARFHWVDSIAADSAGNFYVPNYSMVYKGLLMAAPVIVTQPASQTVSSGGSVQFSVSANATPTPTYQWYVNGTAISGATGTTLGFSNARTSDAGDYTVVVTNSAGSVTSSKAALTVSAASTPTPESPSPSSGSGGGALSGWFVGVLALLMAVVRKSRSEAIPPAV